MTDHKPIPRCPYCGAEMGIDVVESYLGWCGQAVCKECRSRAALERYYVRQEEAEQAAYEAAMQRWQEPNRALTLEEVQALAYAEYEQQHVLSVEYRAIIKGAENVFRPCVVAHESLSMVGILELYDGANMKLMEKSMYGKCWRCWLRKPTQKEMEAVPWEST